MKPPTLIDGVRVESNGKPLTFNSEQWLTMTPLDSEDDRLWEFSITTGRIIKTR